MWTPDDAPLTDTQRDLFIELLAACLRRLPLAAAPHALAACAATLRAFTDDTDRRSMVNLTLMRQLKATRLKPGLPQLVERAS